MDSTIWQEPDHTRIVWITLMAMADRDGEIAASIPGLAARARVPLAAAEIALGTFLAPDQYSRTEAHEGRRIEKIDGGWRLLNYFKYRETLDQDDMREKTAKRVRAFRERKLLRNVTVTHRNAGNVTVTDVTPGNDIGEVEEEEDSTLPLASSLERTQQASAPKTRRRASAKPKSPFHPFNSQEHRDAFDEFWGAYWRLEGKSDAEKKYIAKIKLRGDHKALMEAVRENYARFLAKEIDYRPKAHNWLEDFPFSGKSPEKRTVSANEPQYLTLEQQRATWTEQPQ